MAKDPPADSEQPTVNEGDESAEAADPEAEDTTPTDSETEDSESAEPTEKRAKAKREFRWPALRRSEDDRLIAGVSGGLGEYFGMDPVIVRIGFIILTFFGGVGIALYLMSWLIVPLGDSGSILANALRSGARRRFRNLAGILLIVAGLFVTAILSRNVFELLTKVSSSAPYLALALIVAGIGLVFWPRRSAPPLDTPAEPLAAPTANAVPPPPSAAGSEWPGATLPDEPQVPKESWRDRRAARRAQRRGQSTVTFLTLAALLVLTGGAILLDRLDMERVLLGEFFAIALLIVAAGLLVSVFVGRNWLLILLGVVLLPPLVVFSDTNVSWWSGYGDVETAPDDISALDRHTNHGIGHLVVDLRNLDRDSLRSAVGRYNIGLTVGEVTLRVPADLRVRTNVNVGAGTLRSGEYVTVRHVMMPRIEDGQLYCVDAQYGYRVDEEIPDFRRERAICGESFYSGHIGGFIDYDLIDEGPNLKAEHVTKGDHELQFNIDVGVGQVRVVRFPTRN
ncbi:MAG: PspC domain-containing protein [Acidimicrobiaceae bacterium]|nr:PspC domain-containing protein [Acidimicrobiaceae bacterium]MXW76251.1 PspC domain-containing protein [Acidimicrobiaceae bacterium]MYC41030.1 PspC domain-containing protein [Acidimicrobiaceae bacterium]MYD07035.1 PspC domain-containing protein [Acidimicrobiaceae bacterium]MYI58175.1 PspC domain-containing protein [Acidimicrobiaceae bacterium]